MRLLRDREDWMLVLLAAASIALAFFFARFGAEVREGEVRAIDVAVRDFVMQNRNPIALSVFEVVTLLGAKEVLVPLGALIGWRLFRGSGWWWLILLVFSAIVSAEFVGILKRLYEIGRPPGGIERSMGLSFPSGHSAGAAGVLVFLGYVAVRHRKPAWIVASIAATVTFLVGLSRMYLDMHWVSDVVGGWTIGAAIGVASCAMYELTQRHRRPSRTPGRKPAVSSVPSQPAGH
jgi:membrane-associated phospholipid phosphatase